MESTEWVETTLGLKLTPFQARCVEMLGWISAGIHNAPIDWTKAQWAYGVSGFSVVWKHDHLATWDTSKLTWLVMGCCEARVADFRNQIPADHPILYRNHPENKAADQAEAAAAAESSQQS